MFSTGQIAFAIFFFIAFVGIIIWTYRKDINLHKIYYKGSHWVIIIGAIAFLALLFFVKMMIYN